MDFYDFTEQIRDASVLDFTDGDKKLDKLSEEIFRFIFSKGVGFHEYHMINWHEGDLAVLTDLFFVFALICVHYCHAISAAPKWFPAHSPSR